MKLFLPLLDNGNGSVMAAFMMDYCVAFSGRDVLMVRASDSHANRGMNKIANAFLNSDCDAWLNIDADIRFRAQDVDCLLEHDLPLVYGIYPKKHAATEPCLCTFQHVDPVDAKTGLIEMRRCGRGFMLVKREVLEAMKEDNGGPALRYHNHETVEWDFFPSGCVTGPFSALSGVRDIPDKDPSGFPVREWISEDWFFCERARTLGYKTMVDTRVTLGHVGTKEYSFNQDQVARLDSFIKSWKEIHGWFDYQPFYHEIAEELIARAEAQGKSVFVEVGCWLGRSIAAMHDYLQKTQYNIQRPKPNVQLHVVDTFKGEPGEGHHTLIIEAHGGSVENAFRANMDALGVNVHIHAKPSVEAAREFNPESIDAVFIDGDHHHDAVVADILAWLPIVKPGGILSGHDADEPGVINAVKEIFGDAWNHKGRCWMVRKDAKSKKAAPESAAVFEFYPD